MTAAVDQLTPLLVLWSMETHLQVAAVYHQKQLLYLVMYTLWVIRSPQNSNTIYW